MKIQQQLSPNLRDQTPPEPSLYRRMKCRSEQPTTGSKALWFVVETLIDENVDPIRITAVKMRCARYLPV